MVAAFRRNTRPESLGIRSYRGTQPTRIPLALAQLNQSAPRCAILGEYMDLIRGQVQMLENVTLGLVH
jgi:hypothetical protein